MPNWQLVQLKRFSRAGPKRFVDACVPHKQAGDDIVLAFGRRRAGDRDADAYGNTGAVVLLGAYIYGKQAVSISKAKISRLFDCQYGTPQQRLDNILGSLSLNNRAKLTPSLIAVDTDAKRGVPSRYSKEDGKIYINIPLMEHCSRRLPAG